MIETYKIKIDTIGEVKWFYVCSGRISYGSFVLEKIVLSTTSISDAYAFVQSCKENLFI